ncbi:MAG: 16S rRNA (guanine(527)-N(7))-methyltransferase RsmG [SAR202 cluster bacterium Io17-Chloro-G9]|nr:MAG: 16S rRNA (guanine(527)-N(7))-methyltransferase RsmG [SAR202 cluster bacterium Io17-Chloro-G9]
MEILAQCAGEAGVSLTGRQLDQFETYYQELTQWNRRLNLTSITGYLEVQAGHFLDSLTVCLAAPERLSTSSRVVDVGAGGGFPGLPLKLAFPGIHLVLMDSVGKKAAFLEHLVSVLALDGVEVLTGRAENLAHRPELRESFDLALARGLARLPVLLEYSLPFCRLGGKLVAHKHGGLDQELKSAAQSLETLGGRLSPEVPVRVTGLTDNRVLVVVEKVAATPERYPRRAGVPAKRPL